VAAPILSVDQVSVWEISTGRMVVALKATDVNSAVEAPGKLEFTSCSFSPDSALICTAGMRVAGIWDLQTHKLERMLILRDARVLACEFFPDGRHVVLRRPHGEICVCDVRSGAIVASWIGHAERVRDYSKIALAAHKNIFGVAHIDGVLEILEVEGVNQDLT
jgi:WD40 repeat protein